MTTIAITIRRFIEIRQSAGSRGDGRQTVHFLDIRYPSLRDGKLYSPGPESPKMIAVEALHDLLESSRKARSFPTRKATTCPLGKAGTPRRTTTPRPASNLRWPPRPGRPRRRIVSGPEHLKSRTPTPKAPLLTTQAAVSWDETWRSAFANSCSDLEAPPRSVAFFAALGDNDGWAGWKTAGPK